MENPVKKRKVKKKRFEKLVNWGEEFSSGRRSTSQDEIQRMEDWLVRKEVEAEQEAEQEEEQEARKRDWLVEDVLKLAHKRLNQTSL